MSPEATSRHISSAPKSVDVPAIERELARLWGQPQTAQLQAAQPQTTDDTADAVTRACMSNLIIFCAAQDDATIISQEAARIVEQHPSRVLLLVGDQQRTTSDIEAYVSAQCHLTGAGKQVCSEHVIITTSAGAARRLPSIARPLLIGDLPTALWWAAAQAPPLSGDLFHELAAMADQVIYDSVAWPDAARGVVATADWATSVQAERTVADLAWRRLKPWRRLIGQALDPEVVPGALDAISEVVVEHGPHALPQAWLLIGWLACRLGWRSVGGEVVPGVEMTWAFQSAHGPVPVTVRRLNTGEVEVRTVTIAWTIGAQSARARFRVVAPGRLALDTAGASPSRVLASPPQTRANLIARQLPNLGRDALFRDTLQVSRTMAKSLL